MKDTFEHHRTAERLIPFGEFSKFITETNIRTAVVYS